MKLNLKYRSALLLFIIGGLLFSACKTSLTSSDKTTDEQTVVGEIGGEEVTYQELKENYQSSSPVKSVGQDDLSDFLPVYLTYLAKLKEARKAGYYEDPAIKEEYNNYAEQAAYSYWMEHEVVDSLLNTFVQRSDKEVKAAHILKRLTGQATPSDTAEAYRDLMEARREYLQGAPFDSLIKAYSSKEKGRPLGGEIGPISSGNTIKAFEDAAFSLPVDSISKPIRSQYGYHLVLVKDKRERKPDRKVSHIFFPVRSKKQLDKARSKAEQAYKALESGMKWNKAVTKYSEDKSSKRKEGQIGWLNYGSRVDPAFVDSIMSIDTVGAHTDPLRSKYGYHILRIDSIRSFETEEAKREYLLGKLKELPRYKNRKEIVHQQLSKLGNAKKFTPPLTALANHIEEQDTIPIQHITLPDSLTGKTAYRINGEDYTVGDFYDWLKDKHGNTAAGRYRAKWFEDFTLNAKTEHIIPLTKERFPEFEDKIKNYMDGLVVFQITQDSVWNHAQTDTARLREIYKANRDTFRYDKRYHYYLFTGRSDSLLKQGINRFREGEHPDSIDSKMQGVATRTDSSSYVDEFPFSKLPDMETDTFSNLVKYKDQKAYLYLEEILPPRRMTFDEAYNRLVSYYQPIREKDWTETLRDRYNIKMYPERVDRKIPKSD